MKYKALLAAVAALGLTGCASTVTGVDSAGRPLTVKVGFGNRITAPGYVVEPSEVVVGAVERTAQYTIQTAPQLIATVAAQGINRL